MATDLYKVLGVDKQAKPDAVKRAARRRAAQTHPDRNLGNSAKAEEFRQVILARDVLTDPARRRKYDETGDTSSEPDNRHATLVCTLSQVFQATLCLLKEAKRDFRREDLSLAMRAFIAQQLERLDAQKRGLQDCLMELEPLRGRFSAKDVKGDAQGDNLMEVVVNAELGKVNVEIQRLGAITSNLRDADAWLKGCSYRRDEDPVAKALAAMMSATTSSAGTANGFKSFNVRFG